MAYKPHIGAVVQLCSGGPLMTVTTNGNTQIECRWFVDGHPYAETFPAAALRTVPQNQVPAVGFDTPAALPPPAPAAPAAAP